jgi:hypothetical protein
MRVVMVCVVCITSSGQVAEIGGTLVVEVESKPSVHMLDE